MRCIDDERMDQAGGHAGLCGTDGCRAVAEPRSGEKGPAGCGGPVWLCVSVDRKDLCLSGGGPAGGGAAAGGMSVAVPALPVSETGGNGRGGVWAVRVFQPHDAPVHGRAHAGHGGGALGKRLSGVQGGAVFGGNVSDLSHAAQGASQGLGKGAAGGPALKPFRLEEIRYLLAAVYGDRGGVAAADLDPLPGRAHVGQLHADQAVHGRGGAHLQPSAVRHAGVWVAGLAGRGRGQPQPCLFWLYPAPVRRLHRGGELYAVRHAPAGRAGLGALDGAVALRPLALLCGMGDGDRQGHHVPDFVFADGDAAVGVFAGSEGIL